MTTPRNVSPEVWASMVEHSRDLLARAESYRRAGENARADRIWLELRPLNQRIRALAYLPSDGR